MRSVIAVLAVGLALIGITIAVVLAHSPSTVAGTNSVSTADHIELEKGGLTDCQPAATIPRGTSAIRIGIEALRFNPAVAIRLFVGSHVIREDQQLAGTVSAPTVTVPIAPLANAVHGARICTTVGPSIQTIRFYGQPGRSPVQATTNPLQNAELHMEYLRPGPTSWWSMLPSIAYHAGLGRAPGGTWIVFLMIALMLVIVALTSRLLIQELR
jgi:hypothetical protein